MKDGCDRSDGSVHGGGWKASKLFAPEMMMNVASAWRVVAALSDCALCVENAATVASLWLLLAKQAARKL